MQSFFSGQIHGWDLQFIDEAGNQLHCDIWLPSTPNKMIVDQLPSFAFSVCAPALDLLIMVSLTASHQGILGPRFCSRLLLVVPVALILGLKIRVASWKIKQSRTFCAPQASNDGIYPWVVATTFFSSRYLHKYITFRTCTKRKSFMKKPLFPVLYNVYSTGNRGFFNTANIRRFRIGPVELSIRRLCDAITEEQAVLYAALLGFPAMPGTITACKGFHYLF